MGKTKANQKTKQNTSEAANAVVVRNSKTKDTDGKRTRTEP